MPPILVAAVALVLGCWLGQAVPASAVAGWIVALPALLLLSRGPGRLVGAVLAFGGAGAAMGAAPSRAPWPRHAEGVVIADPKIEHGRTRLLVESPTSDRLAIDVGGPRPDLQIGDRVAVPGPVRSFRDFANPDLPGRGPPPARGLARVASPDALVVEGGSEGRSARPVIAAARRRVREVLVRGLGQPARGVMIALVLGDGGALDPGARLAYRDTGTLHVLAVSGLHVAMVALALHALILAPLRRIEWLARRFEVRRVAACAVAPAILAYTVFAGAAPSAVRAATMAGLALLARASGRGVRAGPLLAVAAAIQVACWPEELSDPGLQLSYAAVAGLVCLAGPLQSAIVGRTDLDGAVMGWRHRVTRALAALVAANLAATATTMPLLAHHFGRVSLAALGCNLLAVPVASLALLPIGLLTAVVALVSGPSALLLCAVAEPIAAGLTAALAAVQRLPFAAIDVPAPGVAATLAMIVLVTSLAWGSWRTRALRLLVVAGLASSVGWARPPRAAPGELVVTILDVGQGDASVIELPGRREAILVDAGGLPGSTVDPGERVVVPYLRQRGIGRVSTLVLSHPHPDHYGGSSAVARVLPIGAWWHNGQHGPLGYRSLLAGIAPQRQAGPRSLCGRPLVRAGVRIEVVAPCPDAPPGQGANDASMVVRIVHGRVRLLFPGDVEQEGELGLLASSVDLESDLVKVPHHGSRTSSSLALVRAVRPRWAVVSAGGRNRFGHPDDAVVQRWKAIGARVLRTDVHGGVRLVSDGSSLRLDATGRPSAATRRPP